MASFTLTKGADVYECDTEGRGTLNRASGCTWTTDRSNRIVITKTGGDSALFDVRWSFNADNHLCLSLDGTQVFDFNGTAGVSPAYLTKDAVLLVRPDRNHAFTFGLRGEWDITNDHDLSITISGQRSKIDGFIDDSRGRFMYHFYDQKDLTIESILGFVGEWHQRMDGDVPKLDFNYKREDGSVDVFSLPEGVTINRSINQLMYAYDKKGRSYRVQFVGLLKISDSFEITYAIDRQEGRRGELQVGATTITIKAEIAKGNFSGDLELVVKRTDGKPGSYTLGVAGNFTAQVGQAKLQAAFVFSQERGPNQIVRTAVGFNGELEFKNGDLKWIFAQNAKMTTISLAGQYELGDARFDGRLNVALDGGRLAGVNLLLGVRF